MTKLAHSLFLIALSLLFIPLPLTAAGQPLSIATSPLPINLTANPGTTVTADLRVKNNGTAPERLKVGLIKFGAQGEDGSPVLSDRQAADSYFDWVKFSPSVFDAPPGEWKTIKMTIAIPKTAAFGYYLAATFSRAEDIKPTGAEAVVAGSSATLVLLAVNSPNTKRQLTPVSFTADHKFYEFLPATFNIKLRNAGNIHVVPKGNIFITKGKKPVSTIDVNDSGGNILPNSNRIYTAAWKDGFPVYVPKLQDGKPIIKNNQPEMTLKWDFTQVPKLRFGKYTASFTMAYNDGTRDIPLTGSVSFWVVPWRVIGVLVFVSIFMIIGLQSTVKKIIRKLLPRRR